MIDVRNVTKSFGQVKALDDLTMHVPAGSVYGLVGPNGAGKTTIIRHIIGAVRPDQGDVLVGGVPVYESAEAKSRIAFVPSDCYFYNRASIGDLAALHQAAFPGFDRQRFKELSALFPFDEGLLMRNLSKGMQKQVAFWLALSQRPDVLLLDEPVDGLDPMARHNVWGAVMAEVSERGMTVLTSSHNLRELTDVCDHVGIMDKGRMRIERTLSDLQDNFVKVQVAFPDDQLRMPEGCEVLSQEQQGRLFSLVIKANALVAEQAFEALGPAFVNVLPLSLEEIFIYELGGGVREVIAD